jgi:DNA mismatch endonuclease (patch repair protein)
MPDVFTKAERSAVMSRIRGRGNKATELALVQLFRRHNISGWRRQQPVFGKPDFIFRRERLALFVDGCFWHGCPRCYCRPKSNREFWDAKIARNRERDRKVSRELRRLGWRVIRVWEHDIAKQSDSCAQKLRAALKVSRLPLCDCHYSVA